ncbi:MAG: hypothetical protein NWE95_13730 [Candidatus Bathyarchaeota archaeon]|nr:hypothetical protein [Candidatus Bathyarchaeota archaeon]
MNDPLIAQVQADQAMRRYYQSLGPAVLIPGLQAIITGILAGGAIGSLAWLVDYTNPWRVWLFGTFSAQALSWTAAIFRWMAIIHTLESWSPNNDQASSVTNTTTNVETLRLAVTQDNRIQIFNLNIDPQRIYQAAALVTDGASFTERDLTGSGRPLSQSEFRQLRDELIRRGFLHWRNPAEPRQGTELTAAGRHLFRQLAVMNPLTHSLIPAEP